MPDAPFTANARAMGTVQAGRIPAHIHEVPIGFYSNVAWLHREASGGPGAGSVVQPGGGQGIKITGENFGSSEAFNHAKTYLPTEQTGETRPVNTAYHPRIHA